MMQRIKPQARYYKIACQARSACDALRMLLFIHKHPNVIGLCMGEDGIPSRILGAGVSIPITYAALNAASINASGQQLLDIHRNIQLNRQSRWYGVIGDPIEQSIGEQYHNGRDTGVIYTKMRVSKEELALFLKLARKLPFVGLSVTAPLKQTILPYLDELDPVAKEISAVNTLVLRQGIIKGYNTDGVAAIDALSAEIQGKTVQILGAGGTARAIAFEAKRRGADVVIYARNTLKAIELARDFQIRYTLTPQSADFTIKAYPGKPLADIACYTNQWMEVDMANPSTEPNIIHPFEMYWRQAEAQRKIWGLSYQLTPFISIDPKKCFLGS